MSAPIPGVKDKCKEQHKLIYVHCYAHSLNLVLVYGRSSKTKCLVSLAFCNFIETGAVHHAVFKRIGHYVGTKCRSFFFEVVNELVGMSR